MTHPNPNSPEALLASTSEKLKAAEADKATLTADLAKLKGELATAKTEVAMAKAKAAPPTSKPSEKYAGARVLSQEQKNELWEEHAKLPDSQQRAFYQNHIQGR